MRSRRWPSLLVVVALLVAGCSSDPGDERIDLGADGSSAEDADGEVDGSSAEDEDGSSAEETPLYPPLPPLDPDPTSDVSIEDQRFFLDLHARVYEATQLAFATNHVDGPLLDELLAGQALDEVLETIARRRDEGVVARSPDGSVTWLEVVDLRNGQFAVQECRLAGARTGLYDEESLEPAELFEEPMALVIETLYELEGGAEYRATSVRSGVDESRCR